MQNTFFDGFKKNNVYAMKVIEVAVESGADVVVLCDTNGGSMPFEIGDIVAKVQKTTRAKLGIHTHNDTENAVANSLMAVSAGCEQVQQSTDMANGVVMQTSVPSYRMSY